jgi:multisubunit Na+/H+ antiporter MnhE subunit
MLVATLSLRPGTLGVEVEDDRLTLHVLDDTHDVASDVRQAERRIGALFGVASA